MVRVKKLFFPTLALLFTIFIISPFETINILGYLKAAGYNVTPGLAEALSTISTVYGVQAAYLAWFGVALPAAIATVVAGMAVASL